MTIGDLVLAIHIIAFLAFIFWVVRRYDRWNRLPYFPFRSGVGAI